MAALLSPFLVPRLQLLGSVPQEDVVLFLGVVVLMALHADTSTTLQHMSEGQHEVHPNSREIRTTSYLRPVVTGSIRKDVAVVVEAASRDGLVELL